MNKNKKGQLAIGGYVLLITGIIVVLTLIVASAQSIGQVRDLATLSNQSLGTMTNGTTLHIENCRALSGVAIYNATGGIEIPSTNYTITNNVVTNGMWETTVTPNVVGTVGGYQRGVATISGVCQPITYDTNDANKTILNLVILFGALALVVFVLENSGITNLFGRD